MLTFIGWTLYLLGVVLFFAHAARKRYWNVGNLLAIPLWPIVALFFVGWLSALKMEWTSINL